MSFYEICGGRPLRGELRVQGAKNSALPILAAALLAPGQSVIRNCPDLSDVTAALEILRLLGCRTVREGDAVLIDASQLTGCGIPDRLMREMRSSVIFLGALLARLGRAELSYPGGCELGPRPIDLHLAALRGLGAEITEEQGRLTCTQGQGLAGRELCLSIPSVGATENAMLAACGARGLTTIVGAAREPEIVDLQRFLNAMGARVSGAGSPMITIQGGAPLHPAEHTVMGDRIAAATYLCAVGAAGGELRLTGVDPADLRPGGGGLPPPHRRGGAVHRRLWPDEGHPNRAHCALSRLSHRRPGHPDGGLGRGDRDHHDRGEYVRQPVPPCG